MRSRVGMAWCGDDALLGSRRCNRRSATPGRGVDSLRFLGLGERDYLDLGFALVRILRVFRGHDRHNLPIGVAFDCRERGHFGAGIAFVHEVMLKQIQVRALSHVHAPSTGEDVGFCPDGAFVTRAHIVNLEAFGSAFGRFEHGRYVSAAQVK